MRLFTLTTKRSIVPPSLHNPNFCPPFEDFGDAFGRPSAVTPYSAKIQCDPSPPLDYFLTNLRPPFPR